MDPIKHTSPTRPKFGKTVGDNALATVKDVNLVIEEVNSITGATGSFTTVDLKTVTVVDGIITSIV